MPQCAEFGSAPIEQLYGKWSFLGDNETRTLYRRVGSKRRRRALNGPMRSAAVLPVQLDPYLP